MANWAQSRPIQYKDYVNVNPIEQMTYVGMQREAELQTGIQKVNNYIEQIAGLDIIRPQDKDYVNNRLNDLKAGITTSLSGDFSDQRIINQIGGAASTIYKDPLVQNAVTSTAAIRRGQSEIESARKAGKSNPNNEDYFNNKVSKYVANPDQKATFSDRFVPYTDIMAKMSEVANKVGVDFKYIDYILNDKGDPSSIMTTQEIETNIPKIRAAIDLLFQDGNVRQQLQVDGWSKYRGYTTADLFNPMVDNYNAQGEKITQEKMDLEVLLSSNIDDAKKEEYQNQLSALNLKEADLKNQFQRLESIATNGDEDLFKEHLYENSYRNSLEEAFSKTKLTTKYSDSPLTKVLQWQEQMKFNLQKEKNDNYYKAANLSLSQNKDAREQAQFEADYPINPATGKRKKISKEEEEKKDRGAIKLYNADNTADQLALIQAKEAEVEGLKTAVTTDALDIFTDYLSMVNERTISKEEAKKSADSFSKKTGENVETYLKRFAFQAQQKLENEGVEAPPQLQTKLNNYQSNFKLLNANLTQMEAAEKEAIDFGKEEYKKAKNLLPDSYEISNSVRADGSDKKNNIILKKDDILNSVVYYNGVGFGATQDQISASTLAKNRLIAKFGKSGFNRIEKELQPGSFGDSKLRNLYNRFKPSIEVLSKSISKKYEILKPIINAEDNKTFSPNELNQKDAKNALTAILTGSAKLSGPDFDKTKMAKALAEEASTVTITALSPKTTAEDWRAVAYVTDKGGETTGLNITKADLEGISSTKFNPYSETAAELFIRKKGTTNMFGQTYLKGAEQGANYSPKQFTSIKKDDKYIVKGDIDKVADGQYSLVLYVKDKTNPNGGFKKKYLSTVSANAEVPNPVQALESIIPSITAADVEAALKK